MSHSMLVERDRLPAGGLDTRQLLVLWQHPTTRAIHPIGCLSHDGPEFSFTYARAVRDIPGFRPLLGMPDMNRRYHSDELPPVFAQRVMSSARRDFDKYAESLGLSHEQATPWEQIARSGGQRAGDTLQFMAVPSADDGIARARFLVNGIRHLPRQSVTVNGQQLQVTVERQEAVLRRLHPGDVVAVVCEQANPHDECATLVSSDGTPIGYVPQVLSPPVRVLIDSDADMEVSVVRVNGPQVSPHLRLTVDLRAVAPEGFSFDPDGQWESLYDGETSASSAAALESYRGGEAEATQ